MKYASRHLLALALAPLALGGTLAACGDSDSTGNKPGDMAGMDHHSDTKATTNATAADVDQAFVRQMIPHHQMAVTMAETAQQQAEHQELKTLADDIIASQNKEIEAMRDIAGDLDVTPDAPMSEGAMGEGKSMGADAATLGLGMDEMGMSMGMMDLEDADPFDLAFIDEMIPHHEGAIRMAKAQLERGENAELKAISTAIIAAQEKEISDMSDWRAAWS